MRVKKDMTKAQRRSLTVSLLLAQKDHTLGRDELIEKTKGTKSTLSEDIKALREEGVELETPPRSGLIILKSAGPYSGISAASSKASLSEDNKSFQDITPREIRQWIILEQLREHPGGMSEDDLLKSLFLRILNDAANLSVEDYLGKDVKTDNWINKANEFLAEEFMTAQPGFSKSTIANDLQDLRKNNYVCEVVPEENSASLRWAVTDDAPFAVNKSFLELQSFCDQYQGSTLSSSWREQLSEIYNKCSLLTMGLEDNQNMFRYQTRGVQNTLSYTGIEALRKLNDLDFSDHIISLCYKTKKKQKLYYPFACGLLIYSQDKDQLYLLGERTNKKNTILCLPLRRIRFGECKKSNDINTVYRSKKYLDIYQEMFSISCEDPVDVKVRFQLFGSIESKVRSLAEIRKSEHLRLTVSSDGKELIYEDRIRGMEDFARYLRSFGRSALVVEPPSLVKRMEQTARNVISAYENAEIPFSERGSSNE